MGGAVADADAFCFFNGGGDKLVVHAFIAKHFLNGRAALAAGDGFAVHKVLGGSWNIRVAVDIKDVDAADFLHHPLAEAACRGIDGVADGF